MAYEIQFKTYRNHLHAIVTGQNSADTVARYMHDVLRECGRINCYFVLIEERLEGSRLDSIDIFFVASEGAADALCFFRAIAYVDEAMDPELSYFAETVAVNRGLPVKVFAAKAQAEDWLLAQCQDAA